MKRILVVLPTIWDARQLAASRPRWRDRYEVELGEPSSEAVRWDFDVVGYVEQTAKLVRERFDGVTSSSDYPGATVAAAIATKLGLPGSRPEAVLRCSHKHASRLIQRRAVPEATPGFTLVDALDPAPGAREVTYPCFVKPVKGAFSIHSRRCDSAEELIAFLESEPVREFVTWHMRVFDRLLAEYTEIEHGGRFFLAEELLSGRLVTVEGYSVGGEVEILGVVDSVVDEATGSFLRFDYPSSLGPETVERMEEIARRAVRAMGLESQLFNVEMMHHAASGRISIVEINPRMCGQFADLYAKVHGTGGTEVALALAAGDPLDRSRSGRYGAAVSRPLRTFEPVRVSTAPDEATVAAAEGLVPDSLVWTECALGDELVDFDRWEDGSSYRYAVVNCGGADLPEAIANAERVVERLAYRFEPVTARRDDPNRGG